MELQNLQAFIQVSETGSFSKAGDKLFITQPAVSKRITALEQELDVKLFDRIGKSVQLTEAGQALLPGAIRVLTELDESRRIIRNLSGKIGGALHIGTSHHIGLHRLPPVLRSYTADYPEVDLDIHFMDSEKACASVLSGDLELAIATLPSRPHENLAVDVVWLDPLAVVVSRNHALADLKRATVSDLVKHPAILPSQSTFTRSLLEQCLGPDTNRLDIAMETNYLETIKMMVSIGLGWSVLPVSMLSTELVSVQVPDLAVERKLGVARHRQRTLSNAARAFLNLLTRTAAT